MTEPAAGVSMAAGRYRLLEPLGGGGMATVWLAQDTRLGRQVAVKVISEALAVQAPYLERFRREARIAAGLSHPNLVQVYDFGSDGRRPFLVMEYIDGTTLGRGATEGGPPLHSETLARELLDALGHIHAAGIIHRDVKPSNVLVGPDGRPRLTDFGIAQAEDYTELTETGQVIGTLKYLAPEVARGHPASPQSDLYSLGVLLSEVAGANVPASLARLIKRLTELDPSRRPSSAGEALSALDSATGTNGGTAPTRRLTPRASDAASPTAPTRAIRSGSTQARDRRALGAVGAVVALAVVVVIVVIAASGGGGGGGKSNPRAAGPASANAPLTRQLDSLDRMIEQATAH